MIELIWIFVRCAIAACLVFSSAADFLRWSIREKGLEIKTINVTQVTK